LINGEERWHKMKIFGGGRGGKIFFKSYFLNSNLIRIKFMSDSFQIFYLKLLLQSTSLSKNNKVPVVDLIVIVKKYVTSFAEP